MYVESSSLAFPGPPLVRRNGISNPLSAPVKHIVRVRRIISLINGSFIFNRIWKSVAPSTFAASYTDGSS